MPSFGLVNLVALALVALVALSLSEPVNALAADRAQVARHVRARNAMTRRKRDSAQCQPAPSSSIPASTPTSATPTSTSTSAPTSTSTPTTTSSSVAPSPTSSNSKKWCLAWGYDSQSLGNFANLNGVGAIYVWSPDVPQQAWSYPNLQRMPMLWGPNQIQDFQSTVHAGYGQYVLGPNEPDIPSQANLSPADAYGIWMQYINPLHSQGYTLVSPACVDDTSGFQWYTDFFSMCDAPNTGCIVDQIAFHSYVTDPQHLIDFATNLTTTFNRPVMITEFADQNYSGSGPQATQDQIWDYAGKIKPFVENTPWITKACPFGLVSTDTFSQYGVNALNALVDGNGNPTPLGYFYLN